MGITLITQKQRILYQPKKWMVAAPICLATHTIGNARKHAMQSDALDKAYLQDKQVITDLRTNHAGELGAVYIYKGILCLSYDKSVRAFARHHLETESKHLALMIDLLPARQRSMLAPLWRLAGWITGAIPALLGPNAVFRTIESVESFVDLHYQHQIDRLSQSGDHPAILALLCACQADEIDHKHEAAEKAGKPAGLFLKGWLWLVKTGSHNAVRLAKLI